MLVIKHGLLLFILSLYDDLAFFFKRSKNMTLNTRGIHKFEDLIFNSIFVTIVLALLLFPYSQALAQEQFLTYEDITTGISIQFPSNWEKSVNLNNFVTFRAPPETDTRVYPAALGLKIQELTSQNVPLQEVTKVQMSELKKTNPDLEISESSSTTLAGKPAHKVVFSATDNNQVKRKALQLWTVVDNKAILITYKAQPDKYSSYLPTIEKMINSFQVKS
jgi:serine/threonine-protein kinase